MRQTIIAFVVGCAVATSFILSFITIEKMDYREGYESGYRMMESVCRELIINYL